MNTEKRTLEIVSGPSRDALFDACKYAYQKDVEYTLKFGIVLSYATHVQQFNPKTDYAPMPVKELRVVGIQHEDGSGESFNLIGYCLADLKPLQNSVVFRPYRFEAYYNTKRRCGNITLIQQ